MKLHHFIMAKDTDQTEQIEKVRSVGKRLASQVTLQPTQVVEAKKKTDTKKIETSDDPEQAMRDFAVDQLAHSKEHIHHVAHHKIKHYD